MVFSHIWLRNLLPVVVSPLDLLLDLISLMLCFMHLDHLSLPLPELRLILHHDLSIGLLLHSPHSLFIFLLLPCLSIFLDLHLSLLLNVLLLIGSQTLEMVGYIAVLGMLTSSCGMIFGHEVTRVNQDYFVLVLSLLVSFPLGLTLTLV